MTVNSATVCSIPPLLAFLQGHEVVTACNDEHYLVQLFMSLQEVVE